MVFDPDMEDDAMCQGFTMVTPDDLPASIPGRSLCDNMESQRIVTGKMRSQNMSRSGNDEALVQAYPDAQFGNKALSSDARTVGLTPHVGKFTDNGMGEFKHNRPPELYESANGPMDIDDGDEGSADEDE